MNLLCAVCATTPGLGSWKMWFVMACLKRRRTFISLTLILAAISEYVVVDPSGKRFAEYVSLIPFKSDIEMNYRCAID
jgi:hypothetical protein